MISSGRSFTCAPLMGCGELLTEALEPAADAAVRAERADLEDDPSDEAGVDRAGRLDLAAGRLLDLVDDGSGLVLGELVRRGAARRRGGSARARRAPGAPAFISASSPARPFSATSRTKLRTNRRRPRSSWSSSAAFCGGSICGFRRTARSSGTSSSARASAARSSATAPASPPRARPRRGRARTCGDDRHSRRSPFRARRSRARRWPRRSGGAGPRRRAPCRSRARSPRGSSRRPRS